MSGTSLIGRTFGRLTVCNAEKLMRAGRSHLTCQCECGNIKLVSRFKLLSGHTQSCGCLHKERFYGCRRTHAMKHSSEYNIWAGMIQRCENPNNPASKDYAGRGITICPEWRESFESFYADMGPKPDGYTLERIDNNAGYNPSNCKWATRVEQARNRRRHGRITYGDRSLMPVEWAEIIGVRSNTIRQRIRNGWPIGKALGFE